MSQPAGKYPTELPPMLSQDQLPPALRDEISLDTPALSYLLRIGEPMFPPWGCSMCPFAAEPEEVNWADPDEGWYTCTLLEEGEVARRRLGTRRDKVWGEDPVCHEAEWRVKARAEVRSLLEAPDNYTPEMFAKARAEAHERWSEE